MKHLALGLVLLASACGGGTSALPAPSVVAVATPASTASPVPLPQTSASATPTQSPTAKPSASPAPTSTPTVAPTASPVPLALRTIGGAPLSATASQLAATRRNAQAKTQAQGVTNGLPILVESSGMIAAWAGDFGIWTTNVQTSQDIPQTGLTVTPSGTLAFNNPAPAQSCLGSVSAVCAVHPTAWTFGTSSANGKPVGKQTITVAFADGTTGTTADYVYDGWGLSCNAGFAYVAGVPVAQTVKANSDVFADCVAQTIVFPKGGFILAQPSQDQYGRYETIIPTLTAAPLFIAAIANVPMASIAQGVVFAIQTQDGGTAKVFFPSGAGVALTAAQGMSLHSNVSGAFDF